jgi:hypothetical protein
MNPLIKKLTRAGHGVRNFNNDRHRLLLYCGVEWPAPPVARMSRQPRMVA